MNNPRILWVLLKEGPHPVFGPLGKALNADMFLLTEPDDHSIYKKIPILNRIVEYIRVLFLAFSLPRDYDAFLCEAGAGYQAAAVSKKLHLTSSTKIIVWAAWAGFSYRFNKKNPKFTIGYHLLNEVDIFLSPSKYRETSLKRIVKNKKIIIVYGFPNPAIKPLLDENKRNEGLSMHRLLAIPGNISTRNKMNEKGIDLVVESFKLLKRKYKDTTLVIVGSGLSVEDFENLWKIDGLTFVYHPDYENLSNIIKNSSLYVHIGRDDAFPTSALDAMYGGLPVLISDQTGIIDVMDKLDLRLVTPLDIGTIAEKISWYFDLDESEKEILSRKARMISLEFDEGLIANKFKQDVINALKET